MEILNHKDTETQRDKLELDPTFKRNRKVYPLGLENKVSEKIIKCAIEIHKQLGPGLLESIYEECLCKEFEWNEIKHLRQKAIPIVYKNEELPEKYRIDLVVENLVIVEIKCVEGILPVHQAQLLTYLKLTGLKLGLILNFNTDLMKNGIKRMVL